MESKYFPGLLTDPGRLRAGGELLPIPGLEWDSALNMALQNGWVPTDTYERDGVPSIGPSDSYGLFHRYMAAGDARRMAAALRKGLAGGQQATFDPALVDWLEKHSGAGHEILLTSDLIPQAEAT